MGGILDSGSRDGGGRIGGCVREANTARCLWLGNNLRRIAAGSPGKHGWRRRVDTGGERGTLNCGRYG